MAVRIGWAALLVPVLFSLHLLAPDAGAVSLPLGAPPPPFALQDLDGRNVSLDDFRGRPVVLSFFSTWCSRCAEELSFLGAAFAGRSGVAVVLINQDGERRVSREKVAEFRDRLHITFPVLLDEGLTLWERFHISSLPTTVIVGPDGNVLLVEAGFTRETPGRILAAAGAPKSASPGDMTGEMGGGKQ